MVSGSYPSGGKGAKTAGRLGAVQFMPLMDRTDGGDLNLGRVRCQLYVPRA
jgi:hypothetical protein